MVLAERKKQERVSDYILQLYLAEDILRSHQFDFKGIKKFLNTHVPAKEVEEELVWYQHVADLMKQENIETVGHLTEVQQLIKQLKSLHQHLLRADQQYRHLYSNAALLIRQQSPEAVAQPVEAGLQALFTYHKNKLAGVRTPEEQMEAIRAFSDLLSYLSYRWRERNQAA